MERKIIFADGTEFEVGEYPVETEPSIFEKKRLSCGTFRDCVRYTVKGAYADVAQKFTDGASYCVREISTGNDGKEIATDFDKSEYCVAGDIVDHRNGTITVYMGKKTASELMQEAFNALSERVEAIGGIDEAEAANAKLADWLKKIETLTPTVRATVKSLFGLE